MATDTLDIHVIKREKGKITVSLDAKTWDRLVQDYQEDSDFSANKKNLEQEAKKSLDSGFGLTI